MVSRFSDRIYLLICIGFLTNLSAQMIDPILSIYMYDYLKVSVAEVGFFISLFFIASASTKIPAGLLVFSKWLKKAMLVSLFLISFSPLAYGLAASFTTVIAFRLIHGFGSAVFWTTALTFLTTLVSNEKLTSAIALYSTILALGMMIGPVIGALTVSLFGIRNMLFISSFVLLPSIFLALALTRSINDDEFNTEKPTYLDLKIIFLNKRIITVALAFFSFHYAFGVLLAYAPLQAKSVFSESVVAFIFSGFFGYYVVTFLSRLALNRFMLNYVSTPLFVLSLLSSSVALLVISLSSFLWWGFTLGFILIGISKGLIFPITSASVAEASPVGSRMLANAVYLFTADCGALLGPLVASFVASNYGVSSALWLSSLVPVFGISLYLIAARK